MTACQIMANTVSMEKQPTDAAAAAAAEKMEDLTTSIVDDPYNANLYLRRSRRYTSLGYPDLAAGDAYKALLLADEISDESGEYHEQAESASTATGEDFTTIRDTAYSLLIQNLTEVECFRSALAFAKQWQKVDPKIDRDDTSLNVLQRYREVAGLPTETDLSTIDVTVTDLPDRTMVRREIYPWNKLEPDRNSLEFLSRLNYELTNVAPKCEVLVTELPLLSGTRGTMKQLGLFTKQDIQPGEVVLHESSILSANNNLHDMLCDACSSELPRLEDASEVFSCPECIDTVFCTQKCLDTAMETYHPAVCGKEIDAIARDSDPKEASDALYFLLLARSIAMAETQDTHPLELKETASLWGDFSPASDSSASLSLPFSFTYNILYPIHLLTLMDLDIFATTAKYDFWVFNTLYAKFRGVASGRPNVRTGKPEVCAVHPLWCLANHSCAPNVTWEWSGDIQLTCRQGDQICRWGPNKHEDQKWKGGIKAGEEILNHYCDIELDVQQRREWASGPLGGDCICERCLWEAGEHSANTVASNSEHI